MLMNITFSETIVNNKGKWLRKMLEFFVFVGNFVGWTCTKPSKIQ